MSDRFEMLVLVGVLALACVARAAPATEPAASAADPASIQFFETKIRPLLADKCYACHSATAKKLKGGLYLDTRGGVLKGGDNGPAIVPGKPRDSRLITAVRWADEDLKMPPKQRLSELAVADLEKWIAMGAPDPRTGATAPPTVASGPDIEQGKKFWSFRPLSPTTVPDVKDRAWARTTIDRFILAKLEEKNLTPNGPGPRAALIRRAYFDLVGLPPTPEAVDAFVNDHSPDAWDKVIDSLLVSPSYGERWARHWLDVARFAESDGYEFDSDRPTAWPYRDFVIRALNQDLPFDQFVRWQIAGDELAPDDPHAMAATGFLSAGVFPTQITEREFESTRYDQLDDMVSTTGVAFLGMTVGCARCHDHKFDPIGTSDYYRLAACFATAVPCEVDADESTPAERQEHRRQLEASLRGLRVTIATLERGPFADYAQVKHEIAQLRSMAAARTAVKMRITSEGLPPVKCNADERGYPHFYKQVYLLRRGDPNNKIEPVSESFPRVLMRGRDESYWHASPPAGAHSSYQRTALANWLTDPQYGGGQLAARVIVNRVWQHHFGKGIVATPNDFGAQGERPTHPELLDWLASDFIEHGWTLKRLHKLMMTSSVYMESAETTPDRLSTDPHDQLLWRWEPRRLEAEPIRDSMLSVAGLLDPTMYGPGTLDETSRRRSIYFTVKRSRLIPMLMVLDWPEPLNSIGSRPVTTVAPQALLFLNSPQARAYAQALAKRVQSAQIPESIEKGYRLALQRKPTPGEVAAAQAFMQSQVRGYREAGMGDPDQLALIDFCQALLSTNEFIYVE